LILIFKESNMCPLRHKTIYNYPNIFYICCNLFIRQNCFKAVKTNPRVDTVNITGFHMIWTAEDDSAALSGRLPICILLLR